MKHCEECGQPQPENGELHLEGCSRHNIKTCMACKELVEEENYEELQRVKENKKVGSIK